MAIGTLGRNVVFEVSDDRVFTFSELTREVTSRWTNHEPQGVKPKPEFLGAGLQTASLTITLSATLGVRPRDVLEAMRQPLEDGTVTVARSGGTLHLPARFQLVCAMNPCRCGWRGHPSGRCTCSDREVAKYVEKISGPLLDRIDLHVSVPAVEYASMRRKETPESSADVKCRVDAARAVQTARFAGTGVTCNAHMTAPMIGQFCCLDHAGDALMKSAFERMGLTARSHDRILRVARTIADLDGAADIRPEHLAEAIQFRNTDILKG